MIINKIMKMIYKKMNNKHKKNKMKIIYLYFVIENIKKNNCKHL